MFRQLDTDGDGVVTLHAGGVAQQAGGLIARASPPFAAAELEQLPSVVW